MGSYGWIDANGILRMYEYIADDQGYRVTKDRAFQVEDYATKEGRSRLLIVNSYHDLHWYLNLKTGKVSLQLSVGNYLYSGLQYILIYFPRKIFFFEFGNCRKFKYLVATNFIFLPNKLNFCCGNYSREETI